MIEKFTKFRYNYYIDMMCLTTQGGMGLKDGMKQQIAQKFTELLMEKPLEQITVKELAEALGISRQTFYYYFHDIYEIVEWIFETESEIILSGCSTIDSWQLGYILMMQWVQNHRRLVLSCYRSIRKDYVENFMNRILYPYIQEVVKEQSRGMQVTDQQIEFISRFFTLAINATSLDWICKGMSDNPCDLAEQVNILIKGDFKKALRNFEQENKKRGF